MYRPFYDPERQARLFCAAVAKLLMDGCLVTSVAPALPLPRLT